jgi:hypothetical protein
MAIFRDTTIQIDNERIKLSKRPVSEIFQFGQPPYIICGTTSTGKTTLALDLFQIYSEECTKMIYITNSEENILSAGKSGDISVIPGAFRRKPKFNVLNGIWTEIKNELEAHRYNPDKYKSILRKIYSPECANTIIKNLDIEKNNVYNEQLKLYSEENKQLALSDANAFYCETIVRLIVDKAKQNSEKLSFEELYTVRSFISDQSKILLILDDVSAELEAIKNISKPVNFQGAVMKIGAAYKSLLLDILTTGRHKNAIICLFLHDIDLVAGMKAQVENLIMLNAAAANKISMCRTFPPDVKRKIDVISPLLFTSEYMYHFLYLSLSKNITCVGKAELFNGTCIKMSDINKNYIEIYRAILTNEHTEDNDEEDEKEEKNEIFK